MTAALLMIAAALRLRRFIREAMLREVNFSPIHDPFGDLEPAAADRLKAAEEKIRHRAYEDRVM